jgi:uncharacterized membrane protein YfcA
MSLSQLSIAQAIALFFAALIAGALNSVAGGGSFISFPTLLFTGVPPIIANATNTAALTPGSLASIPPYRKEFGQHRRELLLLGSVSAIGGVLGAILLAKTPPTLFQALIPFLLLAATLIFTFGPLVTTRLRQRRAIDKLRRSWPALLGYFGGGVGIMMLAGLSLFGMTNIHEMNALKVALASVMNGVATIAFALLHVIWWPLAVLMAVGAIIGGWGGATLAHLVPARAVRWFVIAVGFGLTIYFFLKPYL